jgi:transposase
MPHMDVLEVVWSRLEPLLPPVQRVGRPYDHDRRLVLEAIVDVMQRDCGWRNLPAHFPPWQTVYAQLSRWQQSGIWEKIWSGLEQPHLTSQIQL